MSTPRRSSPMLLAVTWLIVVLPTLWGLSYTVRSAMKLFAPQPAATSTVTPTSPPVPNTTP